jgi:hypothetical protein
MVSNTVEIKGRVTARFSGSITPISNLTKLKYDSKLKLLIFTLTPAIVLHEARDWYKSAI